MDPARENRVYKMLQIDPSFILLLKNKYLTNEMWKISLQGEPSLFQFMKEPSEEMILFALSLDGANIQYFEQMQIPYTNKYIYAAVHSYPGAIKLLPKEIRTEEIREFACMEDPILMRELPLKPSFISKQLRKDPTLVRFVSDPDEEDICDAIEANPNVCVHIQKFTPKIKKLIWEKYPEFVSLIPALNTEQKE